MTYFTDSPYERMMRETPEEQRGNAPPVPASPPCEDCPYQRQAPCMGVCIKKLNHKERSL